MVHWKFKTAFYSRIVNTNLTTFINDKCFKKRKFSRLKTQIRKNMQNKGKTGNHYNQKESKEKMG